MEYNYWNEDCSNITIIFNFFLFLSLSSNLVSGEGLAPIVVNVQFPPLLIQRQQRWHGEPPINLTTNVIRAQYFINSVLYLDQPQVLVVFADHLHLVMETVGHDHVASIIHHQRVGVTEFHILPVFLSKNAGGVIVYDIDTV